MASPLALALMQAQGSAGVPTPNKGVVAPTNITQATADYNNAMEQQYAAKLGQQNALWGGMAGLGGAGILTLPKLLGGTGAAAAGANPLAYGSTIPGAIGATSAGGAPLAGTAAQFAADAGPVAAATGAADTAAATDAAAAAGGGSDVLASLLALFAA